MRNAQFKKIRIKSIYLLTILIVEFSTRIVCGINSVNKGQDLGYGPV